MGEVISGVIAGYAMAILSTLAFTYLATQSPDAGFVRRWFPEGVPLVLVAVPASFGTGVFWTGAGLVIASVYRVTDAETQANFLGSPSLPFLLGMLAIAVIPLPIMLLLWPRHWWLWTGMSAAFVGTFGWLFPVMAEHALQ